MNRKLAFDRRRAGSGKAAAGLCGAVALALAAGSASAAEVGDTTLDLYGFAMLDTGYQSGQNDPDWFDVLRPTKLPAFEDEFGEDGDWFASVRQSRLGVKTNTETSLGNLYTVFEFELFGTGVDAGQTTFRLRHAYGELGQWGAGQTWSPFMDIDLFPNSVEYWGPNGMAFFRNVQLRWMPIKGDTRLTIALERPGASADQGDFADRIELQNITTNFPAPDLSAEYRQATGFGYVEIAGIVRYMEWTDQLDDGDDLSGDAVGWGINLSSNIKAGRSTFRLGAVYGEGIQNYMNDAPADVGPEITGDPTRSLEGEPLPMLGISAFVDDHRLFAPRHRHHGRAVRERLRDRRVCARKRHVLPGEERDVRARDPVGQAPQRARRLHVGRLPGAVLGEVQLRPDIQVRRQLR
jgi:hypothetical protein